MEEKITVWRTVGSAGFAGRRREALLQSLNQKYGKGNWRIAYKVKDGVIERKSTQAL